MRALFIFTFVFIAVLRHQKKIAALLLVTLLTLSVTAIARLPKTYQSSAIFNFHSDFSKIPASAEFFSEIFDPNELRAEKEAILLGVLSDHYLVTLAQRYSQHPSGGLEWQVQGLRNDIQFVPLSRTTYQLLVQQNNATTAQHIAQNVLSQLETNLRTERLARMHSVNNSMTQQLQELTLHGEEKHFELQVNAARLRLENEIAELNRKYTAEHPKLSQLRIRLEQLQRRASKKSPTLSTDHAETSMRGILMTRQALLQVAIRMEESGSMPHIKVVKEPDVPQWPKSPKKLVLYVSASLTSVVVTLALLSGLNFVRNILLFFPELKTRWRDFIVENGLSNPQDVRDHRGD